MKYDNAEPLDEVKPGFHHLQSFIRYTTRSTSIVNALSRAKRRSQIGFGARPTMLPLRGGHCGTSNELSVGQKLLLSMADYRRLCLCFIIELPGG